MKASTLRSEARKGHLAIYRIAGKDYTTLADLERMRTLCRILEKLPGSGSNQQDETPPGDSLSGACGAYATDASNDALASARARIATLSKRPSLTTSTPSEKSHGIATVIHLKS